MQRKMNWMISSLYGSLPGSKSNEASSNPTCNNLYMEDS